MSKLKDTPVIATNTQSDTFFVLFVSLVPRPSHVTLKNMGRPGDKATVCSKQNYGKVIVRLNFST